MTIMDRLGKALSISPWIDRKEAAKRIGVTLNVLSVTLAKNGWNYTTYKDAKLKTMFEVAE